MTFVGVDGCKAGWFAAAITDGNEWSISVFADAATLWEAHHDASTILLDIPIGLRDNGPTERLCDLAARRALAPYRTSSVFPAPCRPAIYAPSYEAASQLNLELTRKRRLSRQTWAICNKIREVDELLLGQEAARSNIREIHPEVCFWGLAGHAMRYPKRLPEGFAERRRVLQSAYPFADSIFLDALPYLKNRGVARDDVLDALSAAITARLARSRLMSLPDVPEIDTHGLRMEMVYHQATPVQHSLV